MEQLIELLKQIQDLAGVAIDALSGKGGGEGPAEDRAEGGEPPMEARAEGGAPPRQ